MGVFQPRKPPISNISDFEDKGVEYIIKDPELYRGKKCVIAGGGDSALDWAIFLSEKNIAKEVSLVHRGSSFRGHLDSVQQVINLAEKGKINLITEAEVVGLKGSDKLDGVVVKHKVTGEREIEVDHFIPLFGLKPTLGPIADWGLEIEKNAIKVDTTDYSTNIPGIYAVGDICSYPGKLKLILSGFHEGALAARACFKLARPNEKYRFEFTTSSKSIKDRLGVKSD